MLSKQPHALKIALRLCESVGSPYAKRASSMLSTQCFGIPMPNPEAYDNAFDFSRDYSIYTYLRKYSGAGDDRELEKKAILSFKETESSVSSFNSSFRKLPSGKPGVLWCFESARRKVREVLGKFKPEEWLERCEWGPGATSSLRANSATVDKKILEPAVSVTNEALPFYKWILEHDIHMFAARSGIIPEGPYSVLRSEFNVVLSSRLTTVPKKYDERRIIDIQPTANLFLQKGVGSMIRHRLQRFGVNLDDQSRNQWLASVSGRMQLCTIDLAKASDTVSLELVRYLLPDDWFHALNCLRTKFTEYNGELISLSKFSAMGNGYTFELESLIFWSLIEAVYERQGSGSRLSGVYGDDLIVTKDSVKNVITLLESAGFSVNESKSFIRGRFYESCGKHYFDGIDVTPPYQKEEIKDFPSAVRAANRLFRHALRMGGGDFLDKTYQPAWLLSRSICESFWLSWMERRRKKGRKVYDLPTIPFYLEEDTGLIHHTGFSVKNGLIRFSKLVFEPVKEPGDEYALYALSLRRKCVVESPFLGFVTLRGQLKSVTVGRAKATWQPRGFPAWV